MGPRRTGLMRTMVVPMVGVVLGAIVSFGAVRPLLSGPPPADSTTWAASAASGPATTSAVSTPSAPPDTSAARHLLSRATYGVTVADLDRVLTTGREAWLEEQLYPSGIADTAFERRVAAFPAARMSQVQLLERFPQRRSQPPVAGARGRRRSAAPPARILFDLVGARLQRAVYSERQLEAVMTDFWFNHFNVFFAKGADRWLVGAYEREAIHPYVFGRFEDMLLATAEHPAMLFYLDNWQNVAPDSVRPRNPRIERLRALSPEQRRRAQERRGATAEQIARLEQAVARRPDRGLNENYARELLELHTLGVEGGYTQEDVIEVARVFTGWSVAREGETGPARLRRPSGGDPRALEYRFRPELHDPGAKHVRGETIAGRTGPDGRDEGREVLQKLARDPATARHIATQLATAFVSDDPPQALVDELEAVFLQTGGDLREVTRALFSSATFYGTGVHGAKLKSPFQLVASAFRVTDAEVGVSRAVTQTLRAMGELPYMSSTPTGYPASNPDWTSAGGLLQRVNFGLELAAGRVDGVRIPAWITDSTLVASELAYRILVGAYGGLLAEAMAEAVDGSSEGTTRALSLALGSPRFQMR